MKKKYISHANMPPRFPLITGAVGWLLLDRFDAPGWAHGVFWSFFVLLVIVSVYRMSAEQSVDINKC